MDFKTERLIDQSKQNGSILSNLEPGPRKVLLAGLIVFFVLAASTTLLLAYYVFQPEITAFLQASTPTPQCVRPTLTIGTTSYPLEVVTVAEPGSLPTPAGAAGTAWWVSDTFSPFVFILKPAAGAPDLQTTLKTGDPLAVQWADCGREEFVLTGIQPGSPDAQTLLAQKSPGLTVIVQPAGSADGYVILGQRSELVSPGTAEPTSPNATLVDITFDMTSPSPDQKTLDIQLTITNRGQQAITLANEDLSLTAQDQLPASPVSTEPALPQVIKPGESLTITISFPNPGGNTAVLRVFNVTADLYY